jgi:hypothetical protein
MAAMLPSNPSPPTPEAFETLLRWKRAQMKRTGVTDIFEHAWIDSVVRDCFTWPASDPDFGGAMFVLRVKGQPAAVLFCLRAGRSLHAWFVAHDANLAVHSPGLIVFVEAIRAAAEAGFTEMDLGPGDYAVQGKLRQLRAPDRRRASSAVRACRRPSRRPSSRCARWWKACLLAGPGNGRPRPCAGWTSRAALLPMTGPPRGLAVTLRGWAFPADKSGYRCAAVSSAKERVP